MNNKKTDFLMTKILVLIDLLETMLPKQQLLKANSIKGFIPSNKYAICVGCGDQYDLDIMVEIKYSYYCTGCTHEVLKKYIGSKYD